MIERVTVRSGLALALVGLLAACGSSQPGRTSGGVATGAGTGAAIGIIGGPIGIVVGAAVGAGAGALTATNTTPQQVNLGDPLWAHNKGVVTTPAMGGQGGGSLPPPQPLPPFSDTQGGQPVGAPSPGAAAMPESAAIQSQPLAPSSGPTQLTPPPAQNYQYHPQ